MQRRGRSPSVSSASRTVALRPAIARSAESVAVINSAMVCCIDVPSALSRLSWSLSRMQ